MLELTAWNKLYTGLFDYFFLIRVDCSSTWVKSHVHISMLVRDRQSCGWFWVWFELPLWLTRLDQVDNITYVRIWASLDWHSSLFVDTFEGKSTMIMFSRTCLRSLLKLHENCLIRNCCSGYGLSWHESVCLFVSICWSLGSLESALVPQVIFHLVFLHLDVYSVRLGIKRVES